jgi:signal transduction histidine kinase
MIFEYAFRLIQMDEILQAGPLFFKTMLPVQIAFSSYAIIGLTLLILATSIAVYLLRLHNKSQATKALIVFFVLIALSGLTMVVANAIPHWDRLFIPWQDFWILAAGVPLTYFAYSLPRFEPSREARTAIAMISAVALLALIYCFTFDYHFLFQWTLEIDVSDTYYLLLPFGTLFIVFIFLRRTVQLSIRTEQVTNTPGINLYWQALIHPQGEDALVSRNMAIALSLAFLPAIQTLVSFPGPLGFILSNIGALLATIAIALVYFNYAPEVNSFMAKLVGITLITVLLIFSIFGTVDVYYENRLNLSVNRWPIAASIIHELLIRNVNILDVPPEIAYIVSWDASAPQDHVSYRKIYPTANGSNFNLDFLIDQNQNGILEKQSQPLSGLLPQLTQDNWQTLWRYGSMPSNHSQESYWGFYFTNNGLAYEIGLSNLAYDLQISRIVSKWLVVILISSAFVLLIFPFFFRRTLVQPLENLLKGIRQVNKGDLEIFIPKSFNDEIGSLTDSFTNMTRSLKVSQIQQQELFNRLQESHDELEERVAERTRELSAFTDLTMLPSDYEDISDILQPALNRIMKIGLCQALCVHLVSQDQDFLTLVAYRNLPETILDNLEMFPLPLYFARRIQQNEDPVLISQNTDFSHLPSELRISQYQNYLGSPLVAGGETLGWLSCYRHSGHEFTMGEISLLVALARKLGLIVENQNLRQRIKDVAIYEERQRLARDLHDSVTQLVYSMSLFTRSSMEAVEDGDEERLSTNLLHLADTSMQILREMRFMLFELQPPLLEQASLAKALNARLDMVERRVGIRTEILIDTSIESEKIEREVYYVTIEALNNILKHANADKVKIIIARENGCLRLCVADNGRGFDPSLASSGLGINNMHHRVKNLGGDLRIDSISGVGTKVIATIPTNQETKIDVVL